jgi:hypothetical protein
MANNDVPRVPLSQLCEILGLSARRVGQLITEGIIPAPRSAKYDLAASCAGYIRFLKSVPKDRSIADARKRLIEERTAIATLQRKQLEGTLVEIDGLMKSVDVVFQACKSHLLSIPTALTPRLSGPANRAQDFKLLTDAIYEAKSRNSSSGRRRTRRHDHGFRVTGRPAHRIMRERRSNMQTEIAHAEAELGKLTARRTELQTQLNSTIAMLEESRRSRRDAALDGRDLAGCDKRIAEYRALAEGTEDALTELNSRVSLQEAALVDQRDHAARAQEIATVRAVMEKIEATAGPYIEAAAAFRSALLGIASRHGEIEGLAALVAQIAADTPAVLDRCRADMRSYANSVRAGAEPRVPVKGLRPKPQPAPYVKPDGPPSGVKYQTPPGYRPPHPGF